MSQASATTLTSSWAVESAPISLIRGGAVLGSMCPDGVARQDGGEGRTGSRRRLRRRPVPQAAQHQGPRRQVGALGGVAAPAIR